MKNKNKMTIQKTFVRHSLALSILMVTSGAYALEQLDDSDLSQVNGQDGLAIDLEFDRVNIDKAYWDDNAGRRTSPNATLRAQATGIVVEKSNVSTTNAGVGIRMDTGSNSQGAVGLDLQVTANPLLAKIDQFQICDGADCSQGIGNLAIQTTSPTVFNLKTKDGLFSKSSMTEMEIGLRNANIYLGQTDSINNELNQLIFHNTNFNFKGKGTMFVDGAKGLVLQSNRDGVTAGLTSTPSDASGVGYIDLDRVQNSAAANDNFKNNGTYLEGGKSTNSGLNLELMLNANVNKTNPYSLTEVANSPAGAKGLIRVGASGRMVNSSLQIRGVNIANAADDPLGVVNTKSVMGNSGVALRLKTEFTKEGDSMLAGGGKATTLEIGGAGLNTYGFEFGNLTGLLATDRGTFDSGDIYINLVDAKDIKLQTNASKYNHVLTTSRLGNNSTLVKSTDYTQQVYTGTEHHNSVVLAIRGAEFQSFSRRGRFTTSAGIENASHLLNPAGSNELNTNQWGLALPVYNLNSNIALYSRQIAANQVGYYRVNPTTGAVVRNQLSTASTTTPRLGLSVALSTDGTDRNAANKSLGTKTTSILILDGQGGYYFGLRNIDLLMKAVGTMGVEKGSLNLDFTDFMVALAAEIAGGKLPTATSSCFTSSQCTNFSSETEFTTGAAGLPLKSSDILTGIRLRLEGSLGLSLIPNSNITDGANITIAGQLNMPKSITTNTIQIVDPFNGSMVGLDNIVGRLAFNTGIHIGKAATGAKGEGEVSFNNTVYFNPNKTADEVFRVRDINFYPPGQNGQRLGELAIPGGRLVADLSIVPRNGAF